MIRTVGIFLFDDIEVLDFAGPFEVFSVTGQLSEHTLLQVVTISKTTALITAVNGLLVQPQYDIHNHPPLDIVIIPGGSGSRNVVNDAVVMEWIKKVYDSSELSLTICSGARIPAALGLLHNAPFCTHKQVYDDILLRDPSAKPEYDKRFVQSGEKLYTAAGISAGIDLSFHIIEKLYGKETAENTAEYMEYYKAE